MSFKLLEIGRTALVAAAICAATAPSPSYARSLLYYFDFDKVENGALVYEGVNKGTGTAEFILKEKSVGVGAGYSGGALGTDHAFCSTTQNSLWLGDGNASLGCGTTKGFTISFWLKTKRPTKAWYDFMGFRVGTTYYRCEYPSTTSTEFRIYASDSRFRSVTGTEGTTLATEGVWKHTAFVFAPGTNTLGTCTVYIGGEKAGHMIVKTAGDLRQIILGGWVRNDNDTGSDRTADYIGATQTAIDELAVFDYPATEEQVKWLGRFRPAQPAGGPARAMPLCWRFLTTGDRGLLCENSGTGDSVAYKYRHTTTKGNNDYANWDTGVFGAPYCFWLRVGNGTSTKYWAAFRADGTGADGLGATVGSGFSVSFWLKAGADIANWMSFFGFTLGSRTERLAWDTGNPANVYGYGDLQNDLLAIPSNLRTVNAWQHVCLVWNQLDGKIDVNLDGERISQMNVPAGTSASDAVNMLMLGPKVPGTNVKNDFYNEGEQVYLDELAFFNHSLSPAQISWLAANPPALPMLDATNLVRTVSANGAWAGGLASWTVREWDDANEAWADTTRTTIYPALEDTEVEVAVTFADGVVITNDTFVTPKRLALAAATSAALPASVTLKSAEDSRFAPETLEIGDGLQLTVPLYAASVGGTLTFGADAKIVFDVSNYDGIGEIALVTGGIALPAGESDVLAHFGVTDSRFALSLSDDGKTVYAKLATVAATATWTGAGDGTSLNSAANWECRNSSGVVLGDNALPCELTRVIVCSGSAALNAPVGTEIPWQYLRIEAGNATLAADAVDWRGIPMLEVPEGVTVDLNGKKLHQNGKIEGSGAFTSAAAGGALHVDVPEGTTNTNASVAFKGSLKLVKDGDGTFVAACESQTYTGGTEVADGTLMLGTTKYPLGAKNASVKICAGAVYDMNGCFSTSSCIYAYDLAGTMRSQTATESYGWNNAYRILGGTFVVSGDDARLELSNVYFACPDGTAWFTMNGHTLTFDGTVYVGLGAFRSNDYGKWVFTGGNCVYEWLNGNGPTNVDVEVYAPASFKLKGNADVGGLVYEGTFWAKNTVVSHLLVYGRYLAGPCHLPISMRNGSTLDLSAITGSFDLTNAVANTTAYVASAVVGDMTFQSGTAEAPSVINVNLAGKTDLIAIKKSESPYVVTWNAAPVNVDFVLDAQSYADGYRISPDEKGLLLKRYMGMMILVR